MIARDFTNLKLASYQVRPAATKLPGIARRPFRGLEKNQAADVWRRSIGAYRKVEDLLRVLREAAVQRSSELILDLPGGCPDFPTELLHLSRQHNRRIFRL